MASGFNHDLGTATTNFHVKSKNISQSSTPAEDSYGSGLLLQDASGNRIIQLIPHQTTEGKIEAQLYTVRNVSGTDKYNGFRFGVNADGTFSDSFTNTDARDAFLSTLDSGWINVPTSSDFDSATSFKYRRFGKVVMINGNGVKPKSTSTPDSVVVVGTLPSGYRPSEVIFNVSTKDYIEIFANGNIGIHLPSNWSGNGFWFSVTFIAD